MHAKRMAVSIALRLALDPTPRKVSNGLTLHTLEVRAAARAVVAEGDAQ